MQELTPFNHYEEGPLAAFDRAVAGLQLPRSERKVETFKIEFTKDEKITEDVFNVVILSYRQDIISHWDDSGACELMLGCRHREDARRLLGESFTFLTPAFVDELIRRTEAVEGLPWQLRIYRDAFFLHDGKNVMTMLWLSSHVDVVVDGKPLSNQTSYPH